MHTTLHHSVHQIHSEKKLIDFIWKKESILTIIQASYMTSDITSCNPFFYIFFVFFYGFFFIVLLNYLFKKIKGIISFSSLIGKRKRGRSKAASIFA